MRRSIEGHGPRLTKFLARWSWRGLVLVVGVSLLVVAGLIGWLPGPGGIPLALAGLWVLSTQFDWARRLRVRMTERFKTSVGKLRRYNTDGDGALWTDQTDDDRTAVTESGGGLSSQSANHEAA